MGPGLSAYRDPEAEPIFDEKKFAEFEDTTRPVRKMFVSQEEMDRSMMPREYRDYCAHLFLNFMKCKRDWFPELWKCDQVLHDYQHCTVNDVKHNMMEYERTKRLMARERKRKQQEQAETLSE